jgi:hypothetical protein
METIKTADGRIITKDKLDEWSSALDNDEWPRGWVNVGEVVHGRPPLSSEGSAVLSVKVPPGLKRALEREARNEGVSTSDYVRSLLADGLISKTA